MVSIKRNLGSGSDDVITQIVSSGDAVTKEIGSRGSSPRIAEFFLEFVGVVSRRSVSIAL